MSSHILQLLEEKSVDKKRPDGSPYRCLSLSDEAEVANSTGITIREVQIAALENNVIPERYCRNQKYFSNDSQIRLLQSHVAVIGQGGLGGTVTEILARIGIGSLTLVDGDVFEESNLNRQLLSTVDNMGKQKAVEGKNRVKAINPAVEVNAVTDFLTGDNASFIISNCSVAADCLDSIPSRFVLEEACRKQQIPLVSAAIGGTSGQATVIFPKDIGLTKIYGAQKNAPPKGAEAQLGTLPYAAMLMAAIECAEIISILCRQSAGLQNKLLLVNPDEHIYETIELV